MSIEPVTIDELLIQAREDYRTINRLREALDATYGDVMVLLDQHVSAEVAKEARHRLIERMATGPETDRRGND